MRDRSKQRGVQWTLRILGVDYVASTFPSLPGWVTVPIDPAIARLLPRSPK